MPKTEIFVFCVIKIQNCSAPQNDHLKFSFVKDIKVVVKKMTRTRPKMIKKTADPLHCPLHTLDSGINVPP